MKHCAMFRKLQIIHQSEDLDKRDAVEMRLWEDDIKCPVRRLDLVYRGWGEGCQRDMIKSIF